MPIETVQVTIPSGAWVQASAGDCNIYNEHGSVALDVRIGAAAPANTLTGGFPIPPKSTYPINGIAITDLVFVRIPANVSAGSTPSVKIWVARNA
jgi:hypothetical protein